MTVTHVQCDTRPTSLVPNYTAWWQRHMCVNNLPGVALDNGAAGIRTRVLLIASPASHRYATKPQSTRNIVYFCLTFQRLFRVKPGPAKVSDGRQPLEIAGSRFLTDWIPFLSPNQQCRSTEEIYIWHATLLFWCTRYIVIIIQCVCLQTGDYASSTDMGSVYSQTSAGSELLASGKTVCTVSDFILVLKPIP